MAERQEMGRDIFQILRDDHSALTSLMEEIRDAGKREKQDLCRRLESTLNEHMDLEEKYLYPILLYFEELSDMIQDSYTDHDSIKEILEQMHGQDVGSEEWESNFLALEDAKDDHIEIEENEVFSQAVNLLSKEQLFQLAEQMTAEKKAPKYPQARKPGPEPRVGR